MVSRIVLSAWIAIGVFACRTAAAQESEPAPAETKAARVQRAIADYEQLGTAPKEAARRRQALAWIGEIDDPAATEYLQRALESAGTGPGAVAVLEAIAKVPRPQLQQQLWDTLHGTAASDAVRAAAAKAIVSFGERGIDRLLEIVHGPADATTAKARESATGVLIDTGHDRALRTFVPQLLEGPMPERLKLLRRMENVHGVFPVDAARIRLVSEATIDVAATAWRQLAVGRHDRARALAIDMLERLVEEPRPAIAAELIGGLVLVHDPDLHPVLLRFGSMGGDQVRKALRAAAPEVAGDPVLVDFLVTKGLGSDAAAAREVAKLLLADAPAEAVAPLVAKVRGELRGGRKKSLDLAIDLHDLLAKDPTWVTDLLELTNSPEVEVKIVGMSLLLELGSDRAILEAQRSLGHRKWELRSVAYRYLTKCRDTSSIPLLIARFGREEGRLAHELSTALFAHTGTRCWKQREWEDWWSAHRTGFVLPHADSVRAGLGSGSGKTISYHGIPLVSNRAAFLVDFSGSMLEKLGTDKKRTRLAEAKEQFKNVVAGISGEHHVNLILFAGEVRPVWDKLRRASEENKKELLDEIDKPGPPGGTNIFDALEQAFRDPDVDTIYLLTDGEPTVGRLIATEDILEEVQRWNRERQILVHTIGIGVNSDLCRRLAEMSGGVYKYVR